MATLRVVESKSDAAFALPALRKFIFHHRVEPNAKWAADFAMIAVSPAHVISGNLMQSSEIYAKITEIFRDVFDTPSIVLSPELTAADVPGWDSFNHINLIISIEAEFRIKFQPAELETMHNVGALVDRIEKKLAEPGR